MNSIKIKKGYRLNIDGRPSVESEILGKPAQVAVLPEKIPFIKPKLLVHIGDRVKVGSPLFVDKRNPDFKFLSPGGGKIAAIHFGPRRVIQAIVVELDAVEAYQNFPVVSEQDLKSVERNKLIGYLVDGGLWPLIRALPFRDIAATDQLPAMIFISLDAKEPFQAEPQVYLEGKSDQFKFGINVLRKLAAGESICVATGKENTFALKELKGVITHAVEGVYPADDPGVLLYHIKKTPEQNRSWFINGQDVLMIAQLLQKGKYPTDRTVAVAGSSAIGRKHYKTRLGVPLKQLESNVNGNETRCIVGGIFRGYTGSIESFMGFYETSLMLVPEGNQREFMALFNPGHRKPSYSRTFLAHFHRPELPYDCNRHGGDRACIACLHCADVCPVNILPQITYKAILAEEVEEYLENGLLDCVECGLCSYVCPSKIELTEVLKQARAAFAKEQA